MKLDGGGRTNWNNGSAKKDRYTAAAKKKLGLSGSGIHFNSKAKLDNRQVKHKGKR